MIDNGPAFPNIHQDPEMRDYPGMSLRHWTATESLPVAMELLKLAASGGLNVEIGPEQIAKTALRIGDALMDALRVINATN